ncbi:hypothetical protein [Nitratireductor sp. ZSWI3]|uniref:hypothetical protein n=1 Tax=Nitratireductor sp. ZSWI3 TaxID=2966359 RepID=UPI0021504FBD|nr:hypothetical protein [Nitratireductor sp. ZSWI3]MCR4265981.1 hypothetical protein [Nitratireductor sp. ZSWI3]
MTGTVAGLMRCVDMLYTLRVIAVLFAALALVPAGAHLFSMASKLQMDRGAYLSAQRAYDGWSLFGIVVIAALISCLALTVALYRAGESYILAALAFLCLVGTQGIFWTFTFPMNSATENWTMLPPKWEFLRMQWELSHAGSAALNFTALVLLVIATTKS